MSQQPTEQKVEDVSNYKNNKIFYLNTITKILIEALDKMSNSVNNTTPEYIVAETVVTNIRNILTVFDKVYPSQ